jgi:hypothetical protein
VAGQEIPDGWEAEHAKTKGDKPMQDGGHSD